VQPDPQPLAEGAAAVGGQHIEVLAVLSFKTADATGLDVPPLPLVLADEVIEVSLPFCALALLHLLTAAYGTCGTLHAD
jgi:hypothetical protein